MVVVVRPAPSLDATSERKSTNAPAGLRADGSMVPDGSMMPFPMPPFDMDMVWTGCACTEYIPSGAEAAELADVSCERREAAQNGANGQGARLGKLRLAIGWCGGKSIRWWSTSQRAGVMSATVARCKFPKFQRVGPSSEQHRTDAAHSPLKSN